MIGFIIFPLVVMLFMLLGYTILIGSFSLLMMILVILAFLGLGTLTIAAALWEFYFPRPAKTLIAARHRASCISLVADDVGYLDIVPNKAQFPEGLIEHKLGFTFLPKPFREAPTEFISRKKRGRPPKNPQEAEERQKEFEQETRIQVERERMERETAQTIALKKLTLKGMGKPVWLEYSGLAAAFNPYILVPPEIQQDNPHSYFETFKTNIKTATDIAVDTKEWLLKQLGEIETKIDKVRVIIDPRRFKEIHPRMYTRDHVSTHRRINFERGVASVTGLPLGKILLVLVAVLGVIGTIFMIYILFMKPQQPQQMATLIRSFFNII